MFGASFVDEAFVSFAVSPPSMADERRPEPCGSGGGAGFARGAGECSAFDGVLDELFLAGAAGLEVGARLVVSRSIADASATLLGGSTTLDEGFDVCSTGAFTGVDVGADRNCW